MERGRWVLEALGRFGTFDGIVPPVFDAAVRVLHPVSEDPVVRWRDVAERAGTVLHPLAQWDSVVGPSPIDVGAPRTGVLPLVELAALAGPLSAATATPEACLAAFWEGYGTLVGEQTVVFSRRGGRDPEWLSDSRPTGWEHPEIAAAGWLELPGRECLLFSLDVRTLADPGWAREAGFATASGTTVQTPLALWPDDRAWYLATEVDFDSTVIGGSRALVDAVLELSEQGALEALPLPEVVDLSSLGDRVNPRPH